MMRMLGIGLTAALAIALLAQGSLTVEAAQKAQKGQVQKPHFGRGVDIAAIDGVPVKAKQKTKNIKARSSQQQGGAWWFTGRPFLKR
jgi:hypothetical protein